ncbi:MAG: HAD-IA family hydrolase [Thermoanaerobaculaceae bacterium]|nr:HAD-IA family hydrolase [Thermoanaerobaculaceae bacterium]
MRQDDFPAAVLFDVGGTLIECRPGAAQVYADALSRWGPPVTAAEVAPVFAEVWSELTQAHPRGLDRYHQVKGSEREWWGEFLRRVLARLGCAAPWEPVLAELMDAFAQPALWHVFPEVPEVLERLAGRGLGLAAVSNWDSRLPALLERLGLAGFFRAVLVSSLERVEKPGPEIFRRAAERLGVDAKRCVHVGDSPLDDVRGAESAGMRAVLVDRAGTFTDGYVRIRDLRGLYELIG